MIDQINPRARSDQFGSKINRDHSVALVYGIPWATILLASLSPLLPIIPPAPIVPPLALLFLLAWRLLRPGLLPLWAGLPLGLWDDLFSGQPLGSGILLFSLIMIGLEALEMRFPWRNFFQDWLVAGLVLAVYLVLAAFVSGASLGGLQLGVIVPQLLLSIVMFPIVAGIVSLLDRLRLMRVRRIG
ncbi:rod shape-determining protein MreD [Paraurantiacibacter namhicola]|uniref:Uncharacterized protein n=1 Tax=Paraurantiacibacter namhicola TaxID=645517 RepID=A0A1C7D8Y0_9SPHN|nr:rod shape-determining protein MreD [Paraurantiacibacter namhicola]ANU07940.1 hypothetical protein A6F65_01642 [Paraurantiacibacter namhicola]